MRRVLITQIGLVQMVLEPPAIMAERMCVSHCCLGSGGVLGGLVIILHLMMICCRAGVGGVEQWGRREVEVRYMTGNWLPHTSVTQPPFTLLIHCKIHRPSR